MKCRKLRKLFDAISLKAYEKNVIQFIFVFQREKISNEILINMYDSVVKAG